MRRANRAHINLVEQYGAFAGLVVIAHLAGVHDAVTVWCVIVFFWARIAHAIIYISGFSQFSARTVVFTVGFLALLVYAWEIFAAQRRCDRLTVRRWCPIAIDGNPACTPEPVRHAMRSA